MVLVSIRRLTEMSTSKMFAGGKRWPVRRADSLATFMCRLSWNLRASPSWIPQGLSRTVLGLLYLWSIGRISLFY